MQIQVQTDQKRQVIDITDRVVDVVQPEGYGTASIYVRHTTAAITAMDLDPGTDEDFLDFLDSLVPKLDWRHGHDPSHTPDHMLGALVGPSLVIPFNDGSLQLGVWQRIVLIELDGPRERSVVISVNG